MNSVDLIKEKIDFIEVVSKYTNLRKSGRTFVGLCPFHNEKTPSFHVDPDKKLFHCFGCGKGGDVITFIMEIEKLSFGEAIEYLAKEYNIKLPEKKFKGSKIETDIYKLNKELLEFYHKLLFTEIGKEASNYLIEKRGFSKQTIEEFKLGFSPLNINLIKEITSKYPLNVLIRSGNFVKKNDSIIPFMKGRIIIPILSISDRVLGFGGRAIKDGDNPKYKNSPDTPVYRKRASLYGLNVTKKHIREKGFAILVEGYFDLISIYQQGIKNAVASLGTSLTHEQAFLLKKFTDKVVIFYDFDEAGLNAIKRSLPILFEAGLYIEIFRGEKGLDPDDFIKKYGIEEFEKRLSQTITPVRFYLGDRKIKDPVKKKRALSLIGEILSKIDDPIFLDEYINEASTILEISQQYLRDTISKYKYKTKKNEERKTFEEFEIELFERIIIKFIYDNSFKSLKPFLKDFKEEYFEHLKYPQITRALLKSKEINEDSIDEALNKLLSEDELKILFFIIFDKEEIYNEQDFYSALKELKSMFLKNRIRNLNTILKEKEKIADKSEFNRILSEKMKLIQTLDKLNIEEVF